MTSPVNTLQKQWVEIDVDGSPMEAYLVLPENAPPGPAVIVLMEIFGVNAHIREVTERIASVGYIAIAPNYYHRTTRNLELDYTEPEVAEGRTHKDRTTREGILADLNAVIGFLQTRKEFSGKLGCIGFCFGGHVAYIAAGLDKISATASFYAGGVAVMSPGGGEPTVSRSGEIQGEILCLFGENDPLIPQEQTVIVEEALKTAGVRHDVIRYPGAGHGFFCDRRADYNPSAAADAWKKVMALFTRNLK